MSAQDKKRLPDIVDKLREKAIAEKFLEENGKKFKTILEFLRHSSKTHSDDIRDIFSTMATTLKLTGRDKDCFLTGYVLGYEYSKFRIEALDAINRDHIPK